MRPRFVLFGDSITQGSFSPNGGWGASLANKYCRQADVVLRGYSGYNTRWALFLLAKNFPEKSTHPPYLVTVFFGANDAVLLDSKDNSKHVPLEEYKSNLLKIVSHIKASNNAAHIILITPPPVSEEHLQIRAWENYGVPLSEPPSRRNETTEMYAKACIEASKEANVAIIDLWSSMQEQPGWQTKYLSDGLHLTPDGNSFVFEKLLEVLKAKGLCSEAMDFDFINFPQIDANDPLKSFIF
ncbi:hypothetical protein KP509_19G066500 [Ceratopteris richardii]|uniref:SGNH hydrolase-type esterase domain-containing protein n=1 Tax=Ceratopteris richardii TaxID=49495 RepID=A0A8T2SPD7_CERRI|nr:hypothetical protein KP509_19G066500 [Ceratopteris richardii]